MMKHFIRIKIGTYIAFLKIDRELSKVKE